MSGVKQSEEGDELIVRLVEITGKETSATVTLPVAAKSVRRLSIIEYPLENTQTPEIQGTRVSIKFKPHEIITLGIKQ